MSTPNVSLPRNESNGPISPGGRRGGRRWRRWIPGTVVALVILVFLVARIYVDTSAEPRLALPDESSAAPVGDLDGTWQVATGSIAGFRIEQTVLGMSGDSVGRTNAVTGTAAVSGGRIAGATFMINLPSIKVGTTAPPQLAISLDTKDYPSATFALDQPVSLTSAFKSGATMTAMVSGHLTMRGVARPVSATISVRRDGSTVQAAGSMPVALADWGIAGPPGFGALASVADRGEAEFFLVLTHE